MLGQSIRQKQKHRIDEMGSGLSFSHGWEARPQMVPRSSEGPGRSQGEGVGHL